MFRAQAVLLASACLALAPAAFAETHHASSHKPHAKGHAQETLSRKAKLRRAAEADEPPALPHKAHAAKASAHHRHADEEADATPSKASRRHKGVRAEAEADAAPSRSSKRHGKAARAGTEEADATPSRSSKHHGKLSRAEAEEADATPSRSSKHHGKLSRAAAEEADAAPSRSSKRHGKASRADVEEADAAPAKAHGRHHAAEEAPVSRIERARAEAGEGSSLVRRELRSTKACVAAHVRLHGRPHSSRARLALQRECAKEVEAARRRAEEEIAIRTWTPPHGPLIYQGALPRGPAAAAPPPASVLPTDPAALPSEPSATAATASGGELASADTTPSKATGAPPPGAATVEQPPPAQPIGGFFGLFRHRAAPTRKPGDPIPTMAELVGSDETHLKAELGDPELMRAEGDGALWTYRLPTCALYVFLGRETATSPWKVKGAQAGPLRRGGQAPEVDVCLKSGRS